MSSGHDVASDPPSRGRPSHDPAEPSRTSNSIVADLAGIDTGGATGAVWSLPHGGDLDANLVCLQPGGSIGEHANDAVDVLIYVRSGHGQLVLDHHRHRLCPDLLVLIPRGAQRALSAGREGMTYLSIHRSRPALTVGSAQMGQARES